MTVDFNDSETVIETIEALTDFTVLKSVAVSLAKLVDLNEQKANTAIAMVDTLKNQVSMLSEALEKASAVLELLKQNPSLIESL